MGSRVSKPPAVDSEESALRERLMVVFRQMDADKSGHVSTTELTDVCKSMGLDVTQQQLDNMIMAADVDQMFHYPCCRTTGTHREFGTSD